MIIRPCECLNAGYCQRHKKEKDEKELMFCRNDYIYRKYMDDSVKEYPSEKYKFYTLEDIGSLSRSLCSKIINAHCVVGISRSGILPASIIATNLHIPIYSFNIKNQEILNIGTGLRVEEIKNNNLVYLIDDSSWSGYTFKNYKSVVKNFFKKDVITACLIKSDVSKEAEIYIDETKFHFFEWNMFNCSNNIVYDFDGILCRDFTEEECYDDILYLKTLISMECTSIQPKKFPLKIITGRKEKYRKETEDWLLKNGFSIEKIIMYPNEKTHNDQEIAEWKADAFIKEFSKDWLYFESSEIQAKIIARKTKKWVGSNESKTIFRF